MNKKDNRLTFESLPMAKSILRLHLMLESGAMDAPDDRKTIRNDAPDEEWFDWLADTVQAIWRKHECKSLSDTFNWSAIAIYCMAQRLRKNPHTGSCRTASVAIHRGDNRCQKCRADTGVVHTDHVVPRSKNGTDNIDNYQLLCQRCNTSKGNARCFQTTSTSKLWS